MAKADNIIPPPVGAPRLDLIRETIKRAETWLAVGVAVARCVVHRRIFVAIDGGIEQARRAARDEIELLIVWLGKPWLGRH
ncbi:MAG: hypothetical protein JWP25_3618 [Bradyrhizobium sp.]|nr:hypothetical protein [Bradyrhizobium sp.]